VDNFCGPKKPLLIVFETPDGSGVAVEIDKCVSKEKFEDLIRMLGEIYKEIETRRTCEMGIDVSSVLAGVKAEVDEIIRNAEKELKKKGMSESEMFDEIYPVIHPRKMSVIRLNVSRVIIYSRRHYAMRDRKRNKRRAFLQGKTCI